MNDKQLREAIEDILTDDDVEYQYILDEGSGKDKATTAFRDLRVRTTDDLVALFHTYGNRERLDELEHIDNKPNVRLWFDGFYGVDDRIKELNREVES